MSTDNIEAQHNASMDVDTLDLEPSDGITVPTLAQRVDAALASEDGVSLLRHLGWDETVGDPADVVARGPAMPPGWNPSHIPGLMHPADVPTPMVGSVDPADVAAYSAAAAGAAALSQPSLLPTSYPPGVPPGVPVLLTPTQLAHARHESGCEAVRAEVAIPLMPSSYERTSEIRGMLRVAQTLTEHWMDLGDELLGEVSHSAPGLHACVMNVSSFAAQASELLARGTARPVDWCSAFERIVESAGKHKAWKLLALASSAMMAGPFTSTWDNAVEWCVAFWDVRGAG